MIKHISLAAALVLALATPALSQQTQNPPEEEVALSASECRTMFQEADQNKDGKVSAQELAAAGLGEGGEGELTLSEFVAECAGERG